MISDKYWNKHTPPLINLLDLKRKTLGQVSCDSQQLLRGGGWRREGVELKPSWMSASHTVDEQTHDREGGFRGKNKEPQRTRETLLTAETEEKESVNTFLSDLEKQADRGSKSCTAASLEAASLESSHSRKGDNKR